MRSESARSGDFRGNRHTVRPAVRPGRAATTDRCGSSAGRPYPPFVAAILPLNVRQDLTEGHGKVTLFPIAGRLIAALTSRARVSMLSLCAVLLPRPA